MKPIDWTVPQRQPVAGLLIVFLNTLWEVLKRLWPIAIITLMNEKPNKADKMEILALIFLGISIIGSVFSFLYFRFYIVNRQLIVKKGWLKKETKTIPFEKIQAIHIEQGPLHQVLNIVKLSIDTAGSQKAEVEINALSRKMANRLQAELSTEGKKPEQTQQAVQNAGATTLFTMKFRDLLRMSISANHLETFALIFLFVISLLDSFRVFEDRIIAAIEPWLPDGSLPVIIFMILTILLMTIVISTVRIFFTFYNFRLETAKNGLRMGAGLTHINEKGVPFQKIRFISWRANWIRKKMGIWLFEYHIAGAFEIKDKMRVKIPVTQESFIPTLASFYLPLFQTEGWEPLRMHPSFPIRRLILVGLSPLLVLFPLVWWLAGPWALLLLVWPAISYILPALTRWKFRLWANDSGIYIRRGWLGEEHLILDWKQVQSLKFRQSIFQEKRGIASLSFQTASGEIRVPFIDEKAARALMDHALFITEFSPQIQQGMENSGSEVLSSQ